MIVGGFHGHVYIFDLETKKIDRTQKYFRNAV